MSHLASATKLAEHSQHKLTTTKPCQTCRSPPCTHFSRLQRHDSKIQADIKGSCEIVMAGLRIIQWHVQANPRMSWIIENPEVMCCCNNQCHQLTYTAALLLLALFQFVQCRLGSSSSRSLCSTWPRNAVCTMCAIVCMASKLCVSSVI